MAFWCESGAGFSLARGIQVITKLGKNIPVVELRSQVDERDRVESLRAGACDVVLKHNKDHLALVVDRELAKLSHYRKAIELERRYAESQKNCFELLQSSKNAVAFIANGRHVHANPSYRQLFGYSYMTELKGLPVKELAVGVDARRVDDFVVGLERTGAVARSIWRPSAVAAPSSGSASSSTAPALMVRMPIGSSLGTSRGDAKKPISRRTASTR